MKVAHTPGPWIRKGEQVCNHHEVMYCAAANFDCIMPSQTLEAKRAMTYHGINKPETFEPVGIVIKRISDCVEDRIHRMKRGQVA